jgi:hypothetical protein
MKAVKTKLAHSSGTRAAQVWPAIDPARTGLLAGYCGSEPGEGKW